MEFCSARVKAQYWTFEARQQSQAKDNKENNQVTLITIISPLSFQEWRSSFSVYGELTTKFGTGHELYYRFQLLAAWSLAYYAQFNWSLWASDIISEPGRPCFQGFGVSRGEGSTKWMHRKSQLQIVAQVLGVASGSCALKQERAYPHPNFDISVLGGAVG